MCASKSVTSSHFRTFMREIKESAAATIRINEQLPLLREMTAHRGCVYYPSKRLSNCQINAIGGRRFKRTADEKRSRRKWRPQGQLWNFGPVERIDAGKWSLPSGTIATIPRCGRWWLECTVLASGLQRVTEHVTAERWEADSGKSKRRRGTRRLGPTMMDEESFREEER